MSDLTTGTRVRVSGPSGPLTGTIVEVDPKLRLFDSKQILLCMDFFNPENKAYPEICGEGHGRLVKKGALAHCKFNHPEQVYVRLPLHVGMFVPRGFSHDDVKFRPGAVGRLISISQDRATMRWHNVPGLDAPFWVPLPKIRWCHYDPSTFSIIETWNTYGEDAGSVGDILVYNTDTVKMVGSDNKANRYALTRGTLLKRMDSERYEAYDGLGRGIMVRVVSGASPEIIGHKFVISRREVYPFEDPFIEAGYAVEIVADLTFRKKSLQGRKGKVVLGTDLDGDLGIEFPEDIGAGSLDGVGKEGQCLYLPTSSVKKISE